jgi:hypothetical protein
MGDVSSEQKTNVSQTVKKLKTTHITEMGETYEETMGEPEWNR